MPREPRVIHEFEAGRGTIRTTISEFRDKRYIDVRLWVEPRDQPGAALIPTKRGVSVPIEYLDDLAEAVALVRQEVAPVGRRAA
jgi:hypothetical protein